MLAMKEPIASHLSFVHTWQWYKLMYPRAISKSADLLGAKARNPNIRLFPPLSLGYPHSKCIGEGEGGEKGIRK